MLHFWTSYSSKSCKRNVSHFPQKVVFNYFQQWQVSWELNHLYLYSAFYDTDCIRGILGSCDTDDWSNGCLKFIFAITGLNYILKCKNNAVILSINTIWVNFLYFWSYKCSLNEHEIIGYVRNSNVLYAPPPPPHTHYAPQSHYGSKMGCKCCSNLIFTFSLFSLLTEDTKDVSVVWWW